MNTDDIFDLDHIDIGMNAKDQEDAFVKIAQIAFRLGCVQSTDALVEGFRNREKESTTGFEDGFAIPHARISAVTKPAIIVARFSEGINWHAMDGKPINVAIALVIPEKQSSESYLDILSGVSRKLLDPNFRQILKTTTDKNEIVKAVLAKKEEDSQIKTANQEVVQEPRRLTIVGVTACATGVAHTYMARDLLLEAAKKLNWNVYIETQGQKGQEFTLTDEQIKRADAVLLATDIAVDTDRFIGKKLFRTGTHDAIKDPADTLTKALAKGRIHETSSGTISTFETKSSRIWVKHVMSGVSYMIPFIVFAGMLFAITTGISKIIWGRDLDLGGNFDLSTLTLSYYVNGKLVVQHGYGIYAMYILNKIAGLGFSIFMPIMGAYIAYSIAGRAAIAPALISTWVANTPDLWFKYGPFIRYAGDMKGLSIFGALIMGFAVGYLVRWINTWNVNKYFKPIMPIIIIPLFVTLFIAGLWSFLIGGLLGILMGWFYQGIHAAESNQFAAAGVGLMIGLIAGVDMGGPINKIASFGATSLILIDGGKAMGAAAASFGIAPLGAGFAAVIFRKKFAGDQAIGVNAIILGFMGISEGAIPFAVEYTWAAIVPNIICSGIAGMCASLFQVSGWVGAWGGPIIAIFGGVTTWANSYIGILWYFVAIGIGTACHVIMFRILVEIWGHKKGDKKLKFSDIKNIFKPSKNTKSQTEANVQQVIVHKSFLQTGFTRCLQPVFVQKKVSYSNQFKTCYKDHLGRATN